MLENLPLSGVHRETKKALYSTSFITGARQPDMNQHTKDFIKVLDNIKPSRHRYEVFSDWLIMAAASLYSWKNDKGIEEEYLEIAKQYSPEELLKHSQLLSITVEALETTEQDFLGNIFTVAEFGSAGNGQFFTPYHISHLMAEMAIGEFPASRIYRVNDCCCGAGGMLIAAALVMKARGFNYQKDAFFVGQDIDHRCARMAFIQMSLLGMPALVVCGDTITMKTYWQRETIGYHLSGMDFRLSAEAMIDFVSNIEACNEEEKTEPEATTLPRRKLVQGELF
jgi:type I restriction-modification system DNA methylase subunit